MNRRKSGPAGTRRLRIRMYRSGLGDCFLLSIPSGSATRHMLIDCGVITGTEKAEAVMAEIAQDIKRETGDKLDYVVATHEHWDHVSGFIQAKKIFDTIEFGTVLMAWTENPRDRLAQKLKKDHETRLSALRNVHLRLQKQPGATALTSGLGSILGFWGDCAATGGTTTAAAMDYLKNRPTRGVRYCKPEEKPLELEGLDGVRIYVLGPPRNETEIRKVNPSTRNPETYSRLAAASVDFYLPGMQEPAAGPAREKATAWAMPFDAYFAIDESDAAQDPFFQKYYGKDTGDEAFRRIEDDWLGVADELALALDNATNNTSLALAIEIIETGDVLLFPGDAQVGNMLSWDALSWRQKSPAGTAARTVSFSELIGRTAVYKVGHHGSHNATLREKGLERIDNRDLVALLPVDEAMAHGKRWDMPFPPLFERLQQKTGGRIIRCDSGVPQKPAVAAGSVLTGQEWKKFQDAVKTADRYVDYYI